MPILKDPAYRTTGVTFFVNLTNPVGLSIPSGQGIGTGTILDTVLPPAASVADATITKPTAGTLGVPIVITLSAASTVPAVVGYSTADITGVAGTDYVSTTGQVTFPPGAISETIDVPVIGSSIPEGTRTFAVDLSAVSNVSLSRAEATVTINDPNPVVGLVVNNPVVTVTDDASTTVNFTVSLSSVSGQTVSVQYATADGTAVAGTNYLATSGILTFAPGVTSMTVPVTILGATTVEPTSTFSLNLSNPTNSTIGIAKGIATILNAVPAPTFSVTGTSVVQPQSGTASAVFEVTLSAASTSAVTVNYATQGVTAIAGTDFTPTSGLLTFPAGTTVLPVTVPILASTTVSADKTFDLILSGPTNATIAPATGTAVGTILSNSLSRFLTIDNPSVVEGSTANPGTVTFTVTLTLPTPSDAPVVVQYATANGTALAGSDYQSVSGVLTFPVEASAGTYSQTVTVPLVGHDTMEPTKQFTLVLSNPTNATLGISSGVATILNDASGPYLSVAPVVVKNGGGSAQFVVSLSAASDQTITVQYNTADGTGVSQADPSTFAIAGTDYTATSGTLTFAPGATSELVTVPILNDTVFGPNKIFRLLLANPTEAALDPVNGQTTGTIVETALPPSVSVANFSVMKSTAGTTYATAVLQLSAASEVTATVSYATADLTATAGTDYVATSGTATFAPGVTTQYVEIPIIGGDIPTGTRTFAFNLSMPDELSIAQAEAIGTITDPNPPAGVQVANTTVVVSGPATVDAVFTVTLATASDLPVSVNYATANGTATSGVNYLATSGTLTFAPGVTSETVSVPVFGSDAPQPLQTFSLDLSSPVNSTIMTSTATATILNTVAGPNLTVNSVSVVLPTTGTATATFQVTLSAASGLPVTVNYATADETALAGTDYTATTGTLTFAPGQTVETVPVTILASTALTLNKTFELDLRARRTPPSRPRRASARSSTTTSCAPLMSTTCRSPTARLDRSRPSRSPSRSRPRVRIR